MTATSANSKSGKVGLGIVASVSAIATSPAQTVISRVTGVDSTREDNPP